MHIITRKRLNDFAEVHLEAEYHQAVCLLDDLIDQVGEVESHPLASFMEVLGFLIEKYEDEHVPEITEL